MNYEYKVVELSYPRRRLWPSGSTGRDDDANLSCSFCGKSQREVMKLIAGPTVYICDECIELCNEIIAGEYDLNDAGLTASREEVEETASREEVEEKELNCLGADGWELVWVVPATSQTDRSRVYLRRPTP